MESWRKLCSRRVFMVIFVWVWTFLGSAVTFLSIACIKDVPMVFDEIIAMFNREPYLASYAEVVGLGGLPLALALLCRDEFQKYGLKRDGLIKSIGLSAPLILIVLALRILGGDLNVKSFGLVFPYNIWYGFLGAFDYGPLEVFFVIWLIVKYGRCVEDFWVSFFTRTCNHGNGFRVTPSLPLASSRSIERCTRDLGVAYPRSHIQLYEELDRADDHVVNH